MLAGCFADSKRNRIMGDKMSESEMSAEVSGRVEKKKRGHRKVKRVLLTLLVESMCSVYSGKSVCSVSSSRMYV